jgi:hypothetical protein
MRRTVQDSWRVQSGKTSKIRARKSYFRTIWPAVLAGALVWAVTIVLSVWAALAFGWW